MTTRRADQLAVLGLAVATVAVCRPLVTRPLGLCPVSEQAGLDCYGLPATARFILLRFGQMPFRSPYHGGGFPTYVSPDDLLLSPRMLLILALGPWAGLKASYMVSMFLAAWGTYLLVRRQMAYPIPAALASAILFAFGGFFLFRWLQGWFMYSRVGVFPWVLYFWWRSRSDGRWLAPCGLMLAWLLLDAKYGAPAVLWFMVLWMVLRLDRSAGGRITDRLDLRRCAVLTGVVGWAFLLAAVKLAPLAPILRRHFGFGGQGLTVSWRQTAFWTAVVAALAFAPVAARVRRRGPAVAGTVLVLLVPVALALLWVPVYDMPPAFRVRAIRRALWRGLVSFGEMRPLQGTAVMQPAFWWPGGSPIGPVGLILAVGGAVCCARRMWRWALLAGVFLLLGLGQDGPMNFLLSLRQVPFLNVLRNPYPVFSPFLLFCLAVLAGRGVTAAATRLGDPWRQCVPWALAVICAVHLGFVAWPRYTFSVSAPVRESGPWEPYHTVLGIADDGSPVYAHVTRGPTSLMYRNVGILAWSKDLHCTEGVAVAPRSRDVGGPANPEYRGEVYFEEAGSSNSAAFTAFTPLRIRVAVDVKAPGRLVINQIEDANWRTSEGRIVEGTGLLAVDLTRPGRYEVRLWYVPVLFYCGLAVTVLSLAGGVALILLVGRRRRGSRDGAQAP